MENIATYTTSGSSYNLKIKTDVTISQVKKGNASLGNGYSANSKTIFVIGDHNDNYKAYTGISNVPDVDSVGAGGVMVAYVKTGEKVAKFVAVTNAKTSDGDTEGIYILGKTPSAKKDSNDDTIYVTQAYVNGVYVAELELDGYTKSDGNVPRGYYGGVTTSGSNVVDWSDLQAAQSNGADFTKSTWYDSGSYVTDCGDGIISSQNHSNALTYDGDTVVIIVDGTKEMDAGDIDEVVCVDGDPAASDVVVLVPDDDNEHADYVFIIR